MRSGGQEKVGGWPENKIKTSDRPVVPHGANTG